MDPLTDRVRRILSTTPDRWQALAGTIDAELLARRPAAGEWSAAECLAHLLGTELGAFQVRLDSFLAGRTQLAAFNPDAAGTRPEVTSSPTDLARRLAEARSVSLARLSAVGDADLSRKANHAELGPVTLREMLAEWAGHDLMHTVQAERALMQPFIADCGSWRSYFADHDLERK